MSLLFALALLLVPVFWPCTINRRANPEFTSLGHPPGWPRLATLFDCSRIAGRPMR